MTAEYGSSSHDVDVAVESAVSVAGECSTIDPRERALWLDAIGDALDAASARLVSIANEETHLGETRLKGELSRTTYQLRTFAELLNEGSCFEVIIDHANAQHPIAPAPDLRRMLIGLGPVAVFAASNFPFAFSVAGGDTAAALAAGCPVIVKAHPGHPRLSYLTAEVVLAALGAAGAPNGSFGMVFGQSAGVDLIKHPGIRVGAFTGSTVGGRALFDLANARPTPIPFYGELGSINPVIVTVEAAQSRARDIVDGFVASYTLGAGQLCTKPGLMFIPSGFGLSEGIASRASALPPNELLNTSIADRFAALEDELASYSTSTATEPSFLEVLLRPSEHVDGWSPSLYRASARDALKHRAVVVEERFGPSSILVEYDEPAQLLDLVSTVEGTLTATIHAKSPHDAGIADLLPLLVERSGRVLWGGWPTGVTVSAAMQHGGPYPASTSAQFTSVGTTSIRRFLRPVSYQSIPDELLPPSLQESNPLGLSRVVDGKREASWREAGGEDSPLPTKRS